MTVLCIDAGTTVIKAVGYDDEGVERAVVRTPTAVSRPRTGWAEQDMDAVWEAVALSARSVVQQLGVAVDHIAITAQGDGSWLVGRDGAPTGPAILWNDGRAGPIVREWTEAGLLEQAFRVNGSLVSSGLPNAVLTWLRRHDPERLERSAASLTCGGWIFAQMTGEVAVDESDASAPFLDIRTRRYAPELLGLYDMEWAQRLLPELRGDDRRVGTVRAAAAAALGVAAGTPVVMAPYDIAATAIGMGAVRPGQACSILGTTLCTEVVTDEVDVDGAAAGLTIALGLPDRYLRAFPTLAGGEVIRWACEMLGLADPFDLGELAARAPVGAGGLCFLPYLSPAGERAPFLDPQARGSFVGLSLEHRREHLARAVFEGLTLVVQDCLVASRAGPTELRVCGGGAASPTWLQLIADVTGVPVLRSTDTEVGAKGAFIVGELATGRISTVTDVVESFVRIGERFEPDPGRSERYTELFADFRHVRDVTAAAWPRLAAMRSRSPQPSTDPTDTTGEGTP